MLRVHRDYLIFKAKRGATRTKPFFENSVIVSGEFDRLAAVGRHPNSIILVVFVKLGTEAFSIISMRPASRKERRLIDG